MMGDYLFNAIISGNIQMSNCVIDSNDIDDATGGSLDMSSVEITNNKNDNFGSILSRQLYNTVYNVWWNIKW